MYTIQLRLTREDLEGAISLGYNNYNYILDETLSTNPIHYIEAAYGTS